MLIFLLEAWNLEGEGGEDDQQEKRVETKMGFQISECHFRCRLQIVGLLVVINQASCAALGQLHC